MHDLTNDNIRGLEDALLTDPTERRLVLLARRWTRPVLGVVAGLAVIAVYAAIYLRAAGIWGG